MPTSVQNHARSILIGLAATIAVVGLAACGGGSESANQKAASRVFVPIAGYAFSPAPQSHIDGVRSAVEARVNPASLDGVDARMVNGGGSSAEAIVLVFDPAASVDPQVGFDAIGAQLSSTQAVTIGGATGIYGRASNGSEVIVVQKGNVGIGVIGTDRTVMEDVTAKLAANA